MQEACSKMNTQPTTMEMILIGRKNNFRSLLKANNLKKLATAKRQLKLAVLVIANTYTGANFKKPLNEESEFTLNECSKFIFEFYPMLSLPEITQAFKMAAAQKLDVNIETYYGKFNVSILGQVLKKYMEYRNKIISAYETEKDKISAKIEQEEIDRKNEITRKEVIKKYNKIKEQYLTGGEEKILRKIKPFWCKILLDANIIKLTTEQKQECWQEAKKQAILEIKKEMSANIPATRKVTLKRYLKKIESGSEVDELNNKAISHYSINIVLKSIKL
jgi:hypothetical protein